MNKILCNNLVFDDMGTGDGKIIDGSFFVSNSLAEDELSIDTLKFSVRYPLTEVADTSLIHYTYGTPCTYYQNDKLFGKFYLVKVERIARFIYELSFQSAIGLLDDTTHYGGIYKGEFAASVIEEIINAKIPYTIKPVFSRIKLYGWLPIGTRRANLQQVLFACGGCIRKNDNGDVFISTLDATTPIVIPDTRVFEGGKISYDTPISKVEVKEHGYIDLESTPTETVFSGELSGQSFITPKGYAVTNASLVTWDKPYHSLEFAGCVVLNGEIGVNYAIVTAAPSIEITGKPYIHTENIISKEKPNYTGEEKIASVEEATLISLANSASTAERMIAYYGNANTLSSSIILNEEKPTNTVTLTNPFGDSVTGIMKSIDGTFGSQVLRGDTEVVLNYVPPTVVGSRTLVSIAVTTPPTQTVYATGDYFNRAGMVVTANYDDGTTAVINNYQYSPNTPLTIDDTSIVITYTELGVTRTATQIIEVSTVLRRIAITKSADLTAYEIGEVFDPTGMVINAYYSDGTSKELTTSEYTFAPSTPLTEADETITITYEEDGITCVAYQDITVGEVPNLVRIEVTTPPEKTTYKLGEYFNTSGMVVTAYFDDYTTKVVNGYIYSPSGALTQSDTAITISYTRGEVTKTANVSITVVYLVSIAVTTPPVYTSYYEGDSFNKYGMVVTATYSNGTTAALEDTDYVVSPDTLLTTTNEVTITYTEHGISAITTQDVSVTYYPYDYENSIVIGESGTFHLSDLGATHRNLRIVCIGGGTGGNGGTDGEAGDGTSAAIITTGATGTRESSPGQGGAGGAAGNGGEGGYYYAFDVVLDSAEDDIVINIGNGGAGGDAGATPVEGAAGTETTCVIGDLTITSGEGSNTGNGYTDIFTNNTYAVGGTDGYSGANGGAGGSAFNYGTNGSDDENGNTGGVAARGTGSSNDYTKGEMQGPAISQSWSSESGQAYSGGFTTRYTGAYSYTVNSTTGVITTSGTYTVGYKSTTSEGTQYTEGSVYTDVYNGSAPSQRSGTVTSRITRKRVGDAKSNYYKLYTSTLTVTRVYTWVTYKITRTTGYGGGGGGGAASTGAGGNGTATGIGGAGAAGVAATVPTVYGAGGNGGSGGGGGGGAGSNYASITGNNDKLRYDAWISNAAGGAGGAGTPGTAGAQGCVIIYFS